MAAAALVATQPDGPLGTYFHHNRTRAPHKRISRYSILALVPLTAAVTYGMKLLREHLLTFALSLLLLSVSLSSLFTISLFLHS